MRRVTVVVWTALIACVLLLGWGRSWGLRSFPECASGTSFLADLGWLMEGLLLTLVVGAIVAGVFAAALGGLPGLVLTVLTVALLGPIGEFGAVAGERAAGCPVWNDGIASLLVLPAVAGAVIGYPIGWLVRRHRHRILTERA